MEIKDVDKNFKVISDNADGLKYYKIPCEPFDLYGVFYEEKTERFVRLPSEIADSVSENVGILNANTAGGRIRFSTDSTTVSVSVKYKLLNYAPHLSTLGGSGFVLLEERENKTVFVYSYMPDYYGNEKNNKTDNGYTVTKRVNDGKLRNYILYFPNYNDVSELKIGLDENAFVGHGKKYRDIKPILYYGSSITQGGCASRADNSYQAFISKWTDTDFINLGFSGSGLAEDEIVDYMTTVDCSLFICDYDSNAPTPEYLEKTHLRLYERYRAKRPDIPIVFISNTYSDNGNMNAEVRFGIIKKTYDIAISRGDKNVYLIDGMKLFGEEDVENCTVDGVHPNDLGFYKMAKGIYDKFKKEKLI